MRRRPGSAAAAPTAIERSEDVDVSEAARSSERRGPVVLAILDGWGIGRDEPGNAVLAAETPTMDRLLAQYPTATLRCSGEDVGLPAGLMGNSEVGHLNLGAGFVVFQPISRIDRAIATGALAANETLQTALDGVTRRGGTLHLLGLVSDGGVHSHVRHLEAILRLAADRGGADVAIHAFTDGRDTSPTGGRAYLADLQAFLDRLGIGRIATVSGRYYAMDRDRRWDRTARAFRAIALGEGPRAETADDCIAASYAGDLTDEFVVPAIIAPAGVQPTGIGAADAVFCINFRADRMRQLVAALVLPRFDNFDRHGWQPNVPIVTLTRYDDDLPTEVVFPPHDVAYPVARAVSEANLLQFHAAETEKYAHVTYFFNGGREEPFAGEERALVPSPKVATYDQQPEMSAAAVTDAVVAAVASGRFGFVLVNYANCDMVGHTGVFPAAVKAVETVDACLGRVVAATLAAGGVALVTADHGNAEEMVDRQTGQPMTAHTTNPVPVVLVAPEDHPLRRAALRPDGILSAVAPTVLELAGVPIPPDMTQASLLVAP
jgi:2,3-bisphosphoglycerate-independent phosphoglycerate mutase